MKGGLPPYYSTKDIATGDNNSSCSTVFEYTHFTITIVQQISIHFILFLIYVFLAADGL